MSKEFTALRASSAKAYENSNSESQKDKKQISELALSVKSKDSKIENLSEKSTADLKELLKVFEADSNEKFY